MRFFKESKVEVLQEAEVPFGSWRPAEIVSGNGHTYLVRYDQSLVDSSAAVERVPRRLMRPCPPSDGPVCWTVGSILEAFDSYSWKVAEVVRVLGKKHYLVRLLGSSLEMRARASDLRLRMLWQDDKWIVTHEYSVTSSEGGNFGCKLGKTQQLHYGVDNHLQLENQNAFDGDMSRGVKRKSSAISTNPPHCSEITKRLQTPYREGKLLKLVDRCSLHLTEKVDAVDSPCFKLGEKYTHASLNMRKNGELKTNLCRVNADDSYERNVRTSGDLSDTESVASSVGSSSPNSNPHRSKHHLTYQNGDACSRNDDAEVSTSEREISEHDNDELREETHLLELHAYRATMLALYACGSLSWEQEALLTNLRLNLNISTDEHLAELRHLVCQAVTSRLLWVVNYHFTIVHDIVCNCNKLKKENLILFMNFPGPRLEACKASFHRFM